MDHDSRYLQTPKDCHLTLQWLMTFNFCGAGEMRYFQCLDFAMSPSRFTLMRVNISIEIIIWFLSFLGISILRTHQADPLLKRLRWSWKRVVMDPLLIPSWEAMYWNSTIILAYVLYHSKFPWWLQLMDHHVRDDPHMNLSLVWRK